MNHFHNSLPGRAGSLLSGIVDDRMRVAAELLIAGVAFQESGKVWRVISHDGDEIGEMSTYMVSETTHVLKSLGLRRTCITNVQAGERDSVTFGHYYDDGDEMEKIMKRRSRKMTTIH